MKERPEEVHLARQWIADLRRVRETAQKMLPEEVLQGEG